ncbi:MAG: Coenzyme F420 hydrogenase/dehydrogenase, beta subunit C-terminal domain [Ruminococcus sp.]|nr:Coenzyme F420 hydrogenase/dehydrogenase, beta subunit C-terminal domain [Ruminococcus sp.]
MEYLYPDTKTIKTFSGYYTDDTKLFNSASGGCASALSEIIIRNNGVVFGVRYTDDFKGAVYDFAEKIEELEQLKSSKYIYASKKIILNGEEISIFKIVKQFLENGRIVLFIGLGCDVAALSNYIKKYNVDSTNLYTVDLICHGPTYPKIQEAYIELLEDKFQSKVSSFSVRYKKKGWEPPFVYAEFENGRVFKEEFYRSYFGYAFVKYSRSSCYNCQFKGDHHVSDLTIGDFWGCNKKHSDYNPLGVSIIFSRSSKGARLIEMLKNSSDFRINTTDTDFAIRHNSNFYKARTPNKEIYDKFKKDFESHGLKYACVNSKGFRAYRLKKYKDHIKRFIPRALLKFIKK